MAKRRRLDPAQTDYLAADPPANGRAPFAAAPIAGVAGDAAASAAADELADTLRTARATGRMVIELPLDDVDARHLVRDRVGVDADEMQTLIASLRARGQQTPIEVMDLGRDARPRYGLISGWRRLQALRHIAEAGDPVTVLALLRSPADAGDAYLAMVEENEIRVNLSYYERARIALKSVEQGAFPTTKAALLTLFHAASRAKRSKIRSFITVVEALDGALAYPEDLGERLGLQLAKALTDDPALADRLRQALAAIPPADGATEGRATEGRAAEGRALAAGLSRRDPDKASGESDPAPHKAKLRPGLYFTEQANGDVVLSGRAMTDDLRLALIDWLVTRKGQTS